jgi:hypothetical protein
MKAVCLISFGIMLLSLQIQAQPRTSAQNTKQQKISPPKETMTQAADSIKMAINDAKTSFSTLFKGHKDTTTIMISGIDYEDPNLALLKEDLKKVKGVKAVSMEYKSSTALIKVPFKGKPTTLWDEVDASAKSPFKLVEAGENDLVLQVKNAATQ